MKAIDDRMELLTGLGADYQEACAGLADAKGKFKIAEARAFMSAEGTVKDKESQTILAVADEYETYLAAEALERALRVVIDINLSSLDAERSKFARESRIEKATIESET